MKTTHTILSALAVTIAAATPLADCTFGKLYCFHSRKSAFTAEMLLQIAAEISLTLNSPVI